MCSNGCNISNGTAAGRRGVKSKENHDLWLSSQDEISPAKQLMQTAVFNSKIIHLEYCSFYS